jgi:hypothetical protein
VLGSLLDQLPGAFSRRFLVAVLLPLLLFFAASFLVGVTFVPAIQGLFTWFDAQSASAQAVLGGIAALGLAAVGMSLSTLSTLGRRLLEGDVGKSLLNGLAKLREADRDKASEALDSARTRRRFANSFVTGSVNELLEARKKGDADAQLPCDYPQRDSKLPDDIQRAKTNQALDDQEAEALRGLARRLAEQLRSNHQGARNDAARMLDASHGELRTILEAIQEAGAHAHTKAFIAFEERFPDGQIYLTRLGRIAGTMVSYAKRRYGADHAVVWPRIEALARKEQPELFAQLEEASTKLEFHVAMFWVTALFTLLWTPWLAISGLDPLLFVLVAVLGPITCWIWHDLAARSYIALAQQTATVVDLVRLKVFAAIGLQSPTSQEQEKAYWFDLATSLAYADPHGVPYEHQPAAEPKPSECKVRLSFVEDDPPSPEKARVP